MERLPTISRTAKLPEIPTIRIGGSAFLFGIPQQLTGLAILLGVLAILLFETGEDALQKCTGAIRSVSVDCAPAIVAAQTIRAGLANYEASKQNLLLTEAKTRAGGSESQLEAAIWQHRLEIADSLTTAAQNISFGEVERGPIMTIEDQLLKYENLMATAVATDNKTTEMRSARQAGAIMHKTLLPCASMLDNASQTILEKNYAEHRTQETIALSEFGCITIGLLGLLAFAQYYTLKTSRRFINAGLAAATAVTLVYSIQTMQRIDEANSNLQTAKEEAFDSVHRLWKIRANAYIANGAESRGLYDPENSAAAEKDFFKKIDEIASLSPPVAQKSRAEALTVTLGTLNTEEDRGAAGRNGFTGNLAEEFEHAAFPGEREAAMKALAALIEYLRVDEQIRGLARGGNREKALELCVSFEPGGSNAAFTQFDKAIGDVIDINQEVFEDKIREGIDALKGAPAETTLACLLIASLAIGGLVPRIREY